MRPAWLGPKKVACRWCGRYYRLEPYDYKSCDGCTAEVWERPEPIDKQVKEDWEFRLKLEAEERERIRQRMLMDPWCYC